MSLAARLHPFFPSATVVHTEAVLERAAVAAARGEGPVLACAGSATGPLADLDLDGVVFLADGPVQAEALAKAGLACVLANEPPARLARALRGFAPPSRRPARPPRPAPRRRVTPEMAARRRARRTTRWDAHGP